jgi:hypothetical protein
LVERLVHQGHGFDPVAGAFKDPFGLHILQAPGLQGQQAAHHLKIILHAMVDLAQQRFLLFERGLGALLRQFGFSDVPKDNHRPDGDAVLDFRRSGEFNREGAAVAASEQVAGIATLHPMPDRSVDGAAFRGALRTVRARVIHQVVYRFAG